MRWWPFKSEKRQSGGAYHDAILNELLRAAGGEVAIATSTAAVEAAAGYWARALAGAKVKPSGGHAALPGLRRARNHPARRSPARSPRR